MLCVEHTEYCGSGVLLFGILRVSGTLLGRVCGEWLNNGGCGSAEGKGEAAMSVNKEKPGICTMAVKHMAFGWVTAE